MMRVLMGTNHAVSRCSTLEPPGDPRGCVVAHGDPDREFPFCCQKVVYA